MKFFKLRFMSTSGVTHYYTISKDKKTRLILDYNRECLVCEELLDQYIDRYNVYSMEYGGELPTEEKF